MSDFTKDLQLDSKGNTARSALLFTAMHYDADAGLLPVVDRADIVGASVITAYYAGVLAGGPVMTLSSGGKGLRVSSGCGRALVSGTFDVTLSNVPDATPKIPITYYFGLVYHPTDKAVELVDVGGNPITITQPEGWYIDGQYGSVLTKLKVANANQVPAGAPPSSPSQGGAPTAAPSGAVNVNGVMVPSNL